MPQCGRRSCIAISIYLLGASKVGWKITHDVIFIFSLTYVAEHVAIYFTHSSSALGCTPSEDGRHAIGEACYD